MKHFGIALLLGLAVVSRASAGKAKFSRPPVVTRSGETAKVAFAVSDPTDVEVAVLNARGDVVRHLAAGVLGGKNPPPPPLQAGLGQQLVWDGTDDSGKPAGGGPFQIRVRAGLAVRLGRMIGGSPYTGSVVTMPYRAPGSKEPRPEIPLGWPVTAGASDRFIYVGDCLNHRIVRVDKTYAVERTVKVP
jgi:hypothetical protein